MKNTYPQRKPMRLHGYDYGSQGAYFVTICTNQRRPFFQDETCKQMADLTWNQLPQRFPTIYLDAFAILPDHIHGIIWLEPTQTQKPTLWAIMRAYKSLLYHRCIDHVRKNSPENVRTIWQESYYDCILETDLDLEHTRIYVNNNLDKYLSIGDYLDYIFDLTEQE
jgi:putative transposase